MTATMTAKTAFDLIVTLQFGYFGLLLYVSSKSVNWALGIDDFGTDCAAWRLMRRRRTLTHSPASRHGATPLKITMENNKSDVIAYLQSIGAPQ